VWARIRAALARRGLVVAGLRTAEPHHDGCPHWHLIVYGPPEDLTFARHIAGWHALADSGDEPGADKHRFNFKVAESGTGAAAYAAAYVSKNIDGGGMDGERDMETGGYKSSTVKRVDAWASCWGIRQFQFFGMPGVGIWRTLRRVDCGGGRVDVVEKAAGDLLAGFGIAGRIGSGGEEKKVEVRRVKTSGLCEGSALEEARRCADGSDWCGFWLACERGGLSLIKSAGERLTEYGDSAAAAVVGVSEGAARLLLKVRNWVIHWNGQAKKLAGVALDLPRSCVINCTGGDPVERSVEEKDERIIEEARRHREDAARKIFAMQRDFEDLAAAIFDGAEAFAA